MTRIAIIALGLALLVLAATHGAKYHRGTSMAEAMVIIALLLSVPGLIRAMAPACR
jgi:hypothetical protein